MSRIENKINKPKNGCQSRNYLNRSDLSHQNQPSKKDMQSYLISHVLFDGKEEVQVNKHQLQDVDEEQNAEVEIRAKNIQEESEDRLFEAYKQEMEKYLSCFGDDSAADKKKKRKKVGKKEDLEKKPILNIGTIKNQFESLASPEVVNVEPPKLRPKKVGKLEATKMFEEKELETKKKEYVPIVIDKDAFERTMGRFEHYKDEEEERERRREEQKRKKLEEERIRLENEREEMEKKERE